MIGGDIDIVATNRNQRDLYLESPGSLTFEIQDVPAITAVAREQRAITTIADNTWATRLCSSGHFDHEVDISLHAATKYMVGHADAMLGVVVCATPEITFMTVKTNAHVHGICAGPDDLYLGQRGLAVAWPFGFDTMSRQR